MRTVRTAFVASLGLALVAACGGGADPAADTPPPATPTGAQESASDGAQSQEPPPLTYGDAEGSGCAPGEGSQGAALPDGEWYGQVVSTGAEEIEFDLACWFSGDAAVAAAAEDGEEPPLNDYYVRNHNERTRELSVAADATVTFYPRGDPESDEEGDFDTWVALLEDRGTWFGVWIEVGSGQVVSITEQWLP